MWNSPPANIAADSSMRPLIYPGLDCRSLPVSILKACSTDSAYGPNVRVYRAALRTLLHGDYVDHTITFRECCLCTGVLGSVLKPRLRCFSLQTMIHQRILRS